MPPTTIHSPPALGSFTSLADHQSRTPISFFGAKPVLHYHTVGARALVPKGNASKLAIFATRNASSANGITSISPSRSNTEGQITILEIVDVFVSSKDLTIFNTATSTGILIPYPAISLHAIQRLPDPSHPNQEVLGLYMQLELEAEPTEYDEEPESIELTLLPPVSATPLDTTAGPIQPLFEAVSNCSNLHPDPISQDEEMEGMDERIMFEGNVGYEGISGLPGIVTGTNDGGLPPPFPGSGGWITVENVGEYFDENGNWIGGAERDGGEPLGEGAGRVRGRDEIEKVDEAVLADANFHGETEEEDYKRLRVA